jgi:lysyl-tRNA synthetase class 2
MTQKRPLAGRRTALLARAHIIQLIRKFFIEGGYLEVETPLRIPAPAPESHIDAVPADGWFLHTSPELCMKRLLATGFERVFQICRCWRSGERGTFHLPEFTMLEWYRSETDYLGLMDDCEELVRSVVSGLGLDGRIAYRGRTLDIHGAWERISVSEAYRRFGGISMEQAMAEDRFDELMVDSIEPMLGLDRPAFIYDYPAKRGALARLKKDDPTVAERFELYVHGMELANAYTELNDPDLQEQLFQTQLAGLAAEDSMAKMDHDFIRALKHGMPPAGGLGIGIDRLVMLLTNSPSIRDVILFPLLRPEG